MTEASDLSDFTMGRREIGERRRSDGAEDGDGKGKVAGKGRLHGGRQGRGVRPERDMAGRAKAKVQNQPQSRLFESKMDG